MKLVHPVEWLSQNTHAVMGSPTPSPTTTIARYVDAFAFPVMMPAR